MQRLIHSARVNVFESARFYYWVLMVLTFHLVARHSLIKILLVNVETEWFASKAITAFLYGFVYGCCVISSIFLKKQISKLFLYTWLIISSISVFNEFVFYLNNPNTYEFISSISSGQGFMNIRITFPILFLGVWHATIDHPRFSGLFLDLIYSLTLLNSALICIGAVFDISVFESYPASGRWGYSGFLARGYSVILSSIFLIDLLRKEHFNFIKVFLMVVALLCSGTKAGLLSLGLIIYIILIKRKSVRFGIAGVGAILLVTLPKWMPWLVSFSVFWNNVYRDHGAWGVLFSLRNQNVIDLIQITELNYSTLNWIFGGGISPNSLLVEIAPIDLFVFYGFFGLVIYSIFIFKTIKSWSKSIPFIVCCFSGSLIYAPMAYIVWFFWINKINASKFLYVENKQPSRKYNLFNNSSDI